VEKLVHFSRWILINPIFISHDERLALFPRTAVLAECKSQQCSPILMDSGDGGWLLLRLRKFKWQIALIANSLLF
jgi:hypothetical protein